MHYLDQSATTPVRREVLESMWPYLTSEFGNPSSVHPLGESANAALEDARKRIANYLGARPGEIIFTSGGTESANAALKGISWAAPRGRHLVISAVEHPAVLEAARFLERVQGFELTTLGVDRLGRVDLAQFAAALRADTTLASVQWANNEVGTIQPVVELAAIAAEKGVPFHTDAVQAATLTKGVLPMEGLSALTLSGHKFGAPKGIGILYLKTGTSFEPLIHGGAQEKDRRSGTENVAGAVAMATAIETAEDQRQYRPFAEVARQIDGDPTGDLVNRLAGHYSFVFPGRSGESILVDLAAKGFYCSSGSACAAGKSDPSHVLLAMGYSPEVAQTAVRITGPVSDEFLTTLGAIIGR